MVLTQFLEVYTIRYSIQLSNAGLTSMSLHERTPNPTSTAMRAPRFDWTGQRVLITGGSAGIGFALARELLGRGARVAICARGAQRLEIARSLLGSQAVLIAADLADPDSVTRVIATTVDALGGLSVLVNNAGVQYLHDIGAKNTTDIMRDVDHEIAVNLRAPIALAYASLPHLRTSAAAGSAAIVNISSGLALVPKQSAPTYCATKAGLHSWTISLRDQLATSAPGVRVHEALLPLVDTDMTHGRGTNKRSPESVARDIADGVSRGCEEMHIGRVALLSAVSRLSPSLARRIMRNA